MSILDNNNIIPNQPTPQMVANRITIATRQTFQTMVSNFNDGAKLFWNHPTLSPSEISQALGSNAREVFELHYALGQLINNIKPEAISEGWAVIGQFTMNEDGTVTILPNTTQPPIGE